MAGFGWCRGIEDAPLLKELGFDFIECRVTDLQLENTEETKKRLPLYLQSPLPVRAFNVLFPGEISVVGPEVDVQRIRTYIGRVAETLDRIGAEIVVFGSGRSRSIPEGWERKRAEEQIVQLLNWIADEFQGTGLTLAIEPLNRKESNIINSVAEGVQFARQVNRKEIRVLADFYHMDEEGEDLGTLVVNKDWLAHIHVADTGRLAPGTGSYPYDVFVSNLHEAGYNGLVSAECTVKDPRTELENGLRFLKEKWSQYV